MATSYRTPGVYIEEISKFPPSVAQVETAIPAFIGYTEKAEKNGNTLLKQPTRIASLLEYETYFGSGDNEKNITVTIDDKIDSGTPAEILNRTLSVSMGTPSKYLMYYALRMYFDNGGGPCYITSAGPYSSGDVDKDELSSALAELEKYDEPTLYVFPDALGLDDANAYYSLINKALMQSQKLKDRFVIIDAYDDDSDTIRNSGTLGNGVDLLKYGAAYHPFLKTVYNYTYQDADVNLAHNTVDEGNNTADGDYNGKTLGEMANDTNPDLVLYNQIKKEISQQRITLPPSSAMAGIYARVDGQRGVWKSPANESVSSCVEPTQKITHEVQQDLNLHSSGKSINAIRSFTGKGIIVWGARTLAGNDNEWKYISVRRFFNMVEESVEKATSQFVFEPNDANTWVKVRAMIENFLILQWRAGALAGAKPDQAFYVRVGLGETMTAQDVLNGFMKVELGMAVVRPAEFIIIKFSHKMQEG